MLTDKSELDWPSSFLLDDYHLGFFHPGLREIWHWRRVLILLVLSLPIFDHGINLLLGGLILIEDLGTLVNRFDVEIERISLEFIVDSLR